MCPILASRLRHLSVCVVQSSAGHAMDMFVNVCLPTHVFVTCEPKRRAARACAPGSEYKHTHMYKTHTIRVFV
jgi:hypothetical protein